MIIVLSRVGEFVIPKELEDGHTAIESYLTEKLARWAKRFTPGVVGMIKCLPQLDFGCEVGWSPFCNRGLRL